MTYDPASQKYTLPFENAQALVNEDSPVYVAGGFQVLMSFYRDEPKILEAFKTGKGIAWGEHDKDLYEGTEINIEDVRKCKCNCFLFVQDLKSFTMFSFVSAYKISNSTQ